MKKIALLLSAAAIFASCKNLADNEYEVTGNVDPSWEGRMVILEKPGMMGFEPVDTVKVKDAKFIFKDTVSSPSVYLISVEAVPMQKIDFILEPGAVDIDVDKDTLVKSVTGGTFNNKKYQEFKNLNYDNYSKIQKFDKKNNALRMTAMQKNDTVTINKLRKDKEQLVKEFEKEVVTFIKDNPKAFVSIQALGMVHQMGFTKPEDVKKMFDGFDESLKKTQSGKQIAEYFKQMEQEKKPAVETSNEVPATDGIKTGDTAPQFSAKTPEGKDMSLKQAMGKITIIDFWASWCPPCRAENPHVVALYKKYHAKGLNIIGVSLDKKADAWKKAIADDKLEWSQVSNLMFWDDPIAKTYGVQQIPTTFIIDANGKVIAKDLRGDELENKIKEYLN